MNKLLGISKNRHAKLDLASVVS